MTQTAGTQTPSRDRPAPSGWGAWVRQALALVLSLALTGLALLFLLWAPFKVGSVSMPAPHPSEDAELLGPTSLSIRPGSFLEKKLTIYQVATERATAPLLTVTGSVVARLGAGKDNPETRWDFSSSDLATAYADWLKARAEVSFTETQLAKVRELTKARTAAQTKVVERLRLLVKVGTDSEKDLAAAEADLLQGQIQGRKEEFEAATAVKNAQRSRGTLERQLFQAGVDPHLLVQGKEDTAIVVAEVPEAKVGLVMEGQRCVARFFAYPGQELPGKVGRPGPALAKERRTLRIFFELRDADAKLRPGMFADVGLGTDAREIILVPADALLHVRRTDFILTAAEPGTWNFTEVKVGETHGPMVEILSGLKPGERIISSGAILLQPLLVRALK